jgi:hypothetical protein
MELSSTIKAIVAAHGSKARELATATDPLNVTRTVTLADGTGADQADQSWHDQRTLASGSGEDLDLSGALADAFGDTVSLARVKALFVENLSPENTLVLGNAASAAWSGPLGGATQTLRLRPGGVLLIVAADATAYAVTAGSADTLRVAHGGETAGALEYRVIVIGATA